MDVPLFRADAALVAATALAVESMRAWLGERGQPASVAAMGSSAFEGALTKGDVDVLADAPGDAFDQVRDALEAAAQRAQPVNWEPGFASFAMAWESLGVTAVQPANVALGPIGVQLVVSGSALHRTLSAQQEAMQSPHLRARYDTAKAHGAPLGPDGYWRVKDTFWWSLDHAGPSWRDVEEPVLKVLTTPQWEALRLGGVTGGGPVDVTDAFVHLSTPSQVDETVARHFAGEDDLWLLTLDAADLGEALRWEPSRGGQDFPHLYAPLRLADVHLARPWA